MSFSPWRFLAQFGRKTATGDLGVSAVPAIQDLPTLDDRISRHAELLSKQLLALRERLFPPRVAENAANVYFRRGRPAHRRFRQLFASAV